MVTGAKRVKTREMFGRRTYCLLSHLCRKTFLIFSAKCRPMRCVLVLNSIFCISFSVIGGLFAKRQRILPVSEPKNVFLSGIDAIRGNLSLNSGFQVCQQFGAAAAFNGGLACELMALEDFRFSLVVSFDGADAALCRAFCFVVVV
jgi:hypothetical protein